MAKINYQYISFFKRPRVNDPLLDYRWKNSFFLGQLAGSLQPFMDMAKDVTNLFQPYRSKYQVGKEFAQPLRGIKSLLKGIGLLVILPFYLLFAFCEIIVLPDYIENQKISRWLLSRKNFVIIFSGLLEGLGNILRGITQVVFTPFVILKSAIRGLITWHKWRKDTMPLFEERDGVRILITSIKDKLADMTDPSKKTDDIDLETYYRIIATTLELKRKFAKHCQTELLKNSKEESTDQNSSESLSKKTSGRLEKTQIKEIFCPAIFKPIDVNTNVNLSMKNVEEVKQFIQSFNGRI